MIPRRRKPPKANIRQQPQIRCPQHLAWVRGHECALCSHPIGGQYIPCRGRIEAAHVRVGTDGGLSVKPGDSWAIPLCRDHHFQQHALGEVTFSTRYHINMKAIAEELWLKSPHRKKFLNPRGGANANNVAPSE